MPSMLEYLQKKAQVAVESNAEGNFVQVVMIMGPPNKYVATPSLVRVYVLPGRVHKQSPREASCPCIKPRLI